MFWSNVTTTEPEDPVTFTRNNSNDPCLQKSSFSQIIKNIAPLFVDGSSFLYNPLLFNGHLQTAYTALGGFDDVDLINYGRRLLHVDPENKGYKVGPDVLLYDRFKGESTFTFDIVKGKSTVNLDSSSTVASVLESSPDAFSLADLEGGAFPEVKIPASQDAAFLPPRTHFISEEEERHLLGDSSRPLLIALHGLSGGSYEAYVRSVLLEITSSEYNFDALVVNSRGCAGHSITSPQLFNGLWTNDIRYFINEYMAKNYPEKKIFLIGFSLGGGILANFLAQESDSVYKNILGAAVVGTPWDFLDSNIFLDGTMLGDKVYSPVMSQNLQKLVIEQQDVLKSNPIVQKFLEDPKLFNLEKLHDFDEAFTSKLFGFNNHREYYRRASPAQRLQKVRVPMLVLSSKDDPICGDRTIPYLEVRRNPYTFLVTTSVGGHLGWFKLGGGRWYPQPVSQVFSELFKNWTINKAPEESLPNSEETYWKHDRLLA